MAIMRTMAKTITVHHENFHTSDLKSTWTDLCCTELEAYIGLGSSGSVVSGRVSYCFVSMLYALNDISTDTELIGVGNRVYMVRQYASTPVARPRWLQFT